MVVVENRRIATITNTLPLSRQRRQKDGELQYCSNNATTPGASFSNFINPVVRNKLGSDDAVCTSTNSCRNCHLVNWHKSARGSSQLL